MSLFLVFLNVLPYSVVNTSMPFNFLLNKWPKVVNSTPTLHLFKLFPWERYLRSFPPSPLATTPLASTA